VPRRADQIYIAYSGEFLVRRLSQPDKPASSPEQETHPAEHVDGGPPDEDPPQDAAHYELVIDNDSGTYRPDKELLPKLQEFLQRNFEGLHITTMACDDPELEKIKKNQLQAKDKEGDHMVYGQPSDAGSISSSEASDLNERAEGGDGGRGPIEQVVDGLERPKGAVKDALPGDGKRERERREEAADEGHDGNERRA
jgi:hypothetical protein